MSAAGRAARAAIRRLDLPVSAPVALLTWPFRAAGRALGPRLASVLGPLLDGASSAAPGALRARLRRLLSPWFAPDVSAAPDPLAPAPRVLAGAVAAAVVGVECAGITLPVKVSTSAGFELSIDGDWRTKKCTGMTLTGPTRRVYDGVIDLDAMADDQILE